MNWKKRKDHLSDGGSIWLGWWGVFFIVGIILMILKAQGTEGWNLLGIFFLSGFPAILAALTTCSLWVLISRFLLKDWEGEMNWLDQWIAAGIPGGILGSLLLGLSSWSGDRSLHIWIAGFITGEVFVWGGPFLLLLWVATIWMP